MTTGGGGSRANGSTATGQTTVTTTTDTAPLKRKAGARVTERTAELQSLTRGRATRRGPARMTHSIITTTATATTTTITTGGTAPQTSADLGASRTPWTVDTTRDKAAHRIDGIIATLPLADTVHLSVHRTDLVIATVLLTAVDLPTAPLNAPDTSLPRDVLWLLQINPTTTSSTGWWM